MTIVLAHGALGYWDEVIGLSLLVIGLPTGVMFALLKGTSGRGTTPLRYDPITTGQPLVIKTTTGPASRIIESGDESSDVCSDKRGRQPGQKGRRS